jgi:hypothetical protein
VTGHQMGTQMDTELRAELPIESHAESKTESKIEEPCGLKIAQRPLNLRSDLQGFLAL